MYNSNQLTVGDYLISVNVDGYVLQTINVTMIATGFKTFDFEMVPNQILPSIQRRDRNT